MKTNFVFAPAEVPLWPAVFLMTFPDSKVHGANMGPIWGRQDPGGTHVGPMNLAIWVLQYCCFNRSPMFISSLDAEIWFDTIWHDGLFYKLTDILPKSHWLYLYRLYNSMQCIHPWEGSHSQSFGIFRGTKQVSFPRLCLAYLLMIFWSNYRPLDAVYG